MCEVVTHMHPAKNGQYERVTSGASKTSPCYTQRAWNYLRLQRCNSRLVTFLTIPEKQASMSDVSLKLEDHGRAALHQLALTDERQIRHKDLGCISRTPLDEKRKKNLLLGLLSFAPCRHPRRLVAPTATLPAMPRDGDDLRANPPPPLLTVTGEFPSLLIGNIAK